MAKKVLKWVYQFFDALPQALKFKMRWFPNEGHYPGEKLYILYLFCLRRKETLLAVS